MRLCKNPKCEKDISDMKKTPAGKLRVYCGVPCQLEHRKNRSWDRGKSGDSTFSFGGHSGKKITMGRDII